MKGKMMTNRYILILLIFSCVGISSLHASDENIKTSLRLVNKARENNDNAQLIKQLAVLGKLYEKQDEDQKALSAYYDGIQASKEADNMDSEAEFTADIGLIHKKNGNYEEALKRLLWAEYLLQDSKDYILKIKTEYQISSVYSELLDHSTSLNHLIKAKYLLPKIDSLKINYIIYQNIAVQYSFIDLYDSSLAYFERSREILGNDTLSTTYIRLNIAIGDLYSNSGQDSMAIDYFLNALRISNKTGNQKLEDEIYYSLSISYLEIGDFSNSNIMINKAIELNKSEKDTLSYYYNLDQLATIKFREKKYTDAINAYLSVLDYVSSRKVSNHEHVLLNQLALAYDYIGDSKNSNFYHHKAIAIHSQITKNENIRTSELINAKYKAQSALKDAVYEREIAIAENKQLVLLVVLLSISLLTIGMLYITRRYYTKRLSETNYMLSKETRRSKYIYELLIKDVKEALIPISIFMANSSDNSVKQNYRKVTGKLNQILSEADFY